VPDAQLDDLALLRLQLGQGLPDQPPDLGQLGRLAGSGRGAGSGTGTSAFPAVPVGDLVEARFGRAPVGRDALVR